MSYVQICPYTVLWSIETQLLSTKFKLLKINWPAECTKTTCYCVRWKWIAASDPIYGGSIPRWATVPSSFARTYSSYGLAGLFRVSHGVFAQCCDAKMWPGRDLMCVQSKPAIRWWNFRDRCFVRELVSLCVHCGLYPPAGLQFVLQAMKYVELKCVRFRNIHSMVWCSKYTHSACHSLLSIFKFPALIFGLNSRFQFQWMEFFRAHGINSI